MDVLRDMMVILIEVVLDLGNIMKSESKAFSNLISEMLKFRMANHNSIPHCVNRIFTAILFD